MRPFGLSSVCNVTYKSKHFGVPVLESGVGNMLHRVENIYPTCSTRIRRHAYEVIYII